MTYRGQESAFLAAVVAAEPGSHAEVVQVRAVGPDGAAARCECFAGDYQIARWSRSS